MQSKYADWWWLSRSLAIGMGASIALGICLQVRLLFAVGRADGLTSVGYVLGPAYGLVAAIALYIILALFGFLVLPRIRSQFLLNRGRVRVIIWGLSGIAAVVFAVVATSSPVP
jgi:hypothetical protein